MVKGYQDLSVVEHLRLLRVLTVNLAVGTDKVKFHAIWRKMQSNFVCVVWLALLKQTWLGRRNNLDHGRALTMSNVKIRDILREDIQFFLIGGINDINVTIILIATTQACVNNLCMFGSPGLFVNLVSVVRAFPLGADSFGCRQRRIQTVEVPA